MTATLNVIVPSYGISWSSYEAILNKYVKDLNMTLKWHCTDYGSKGKPSINVWVDDILSIDEKKITLLKCLKGLTVRIQDPIISKVKLLKMKRIAYEFDFHLCWRKWNLFNAKYMIQSPYFWKIFGVSFSIFSLLSFFCSPSKGRQGYYRSY